MSSQRVADAFSVFAPAFLKWQYAGVLVEGMTYPRMRLIHQLAEDGPLLMGQLSERLKVSARNVTVLVDGLEREKLVRRLSHPTDRRATLVEITEPGRSMHRRIYASHADRAAALFDALTQEEQRSLMRVLEKLGKSLAEVSAEEGRPIEIDGKALRG
ncbi:MAG TPA: MarR family transcriptional regulator [Albitalea sp.]|nr:MarR family transcriptional regulator [Albitalea sp.]